MLDLQPIKDRCTNRPRVLYADRPALIDLLVQQYKDTAQLIQEVERLRAELRDCDTCRHNNQDAIECLNCDDGSC